MKTTVYCFFGILAVFATGCSTAAFPSPQSRQGNFGSNDKSQGSFTRTLNVSGSVDLDIATGSGSIDIRQGSDGQVVVHGKIRAGTDWWRSNRDAADVVRELESNPPIEHAGNSIRIGRLQRRDSDRNVSISYEIVIPPQTTVRSHTGSGSQYVTGVTEPVEASTGSGSITLADIRGKVTANTGSGSIRADGIAGVFNGRTGSGSVTLRQTAAGDVEISTGSGSVDANGIRGALRVHTGSGGITAAGEQTGRWELQTSSGTINVQLPQKAGFDLNAHTSSGAVYVHFPMTVQGRIDKRQHDISGKVQGGGYPLELRTSSGNIRIE